MHDTPFEDENNTIREIFYLDVEENKFVRESLKARYEPEAYVRRRQIGTNPSRHLASIRSALESPVILDIGFYFDKSKTSALTAVFWFKVSIIAHSKRGHIKRLYGGERTFEAFNEYSAKYLQTSRAVMFARCDEYALDKSKGMSPEHLKSIVNSLHYSILKEWAKLH